MISQARARQKSKLKKQSATYEDDSEESELEDQNQEVAEIKKQIRVPKNTWIIKPGENTNRGNGIDVCRSIEEIRSVVGRATKGDRTYII
jgi:hypothetical protein